MKIEKKNMLGLPPKKSLFYILNLMYVSFKEVDK